MLFMFCRYDALLHSSMFMLSFVDVLLNVWLVREAKMGQELCDWSLQYLISYICGLTFAWFRV